MHFFYSSGRSAWTYIQPSLPCGCFPSTNGQCNRSHFHSTCVKYLEMGPSLVILCLKFRTLMSMLGLVSRLCESPSGNATRQPMPQALFKSCYLSSTSNANSLSQSLNLPYFSRPPLTHGPSMGSLTVLHFLTTLLSRCATTLLLGERNT